eukprot:CAMPEP_0185580558 /NCGR_PEP_ID=MMETSP0434-20130131/16999_1 /TAXON_ID=626734 ORGANISM="Favella taraikaensis, Strain Fe Narragansett Bay" /NCGR_SAMPLE_ID=MMETSP0434 /ASSEMBLY_ACC=CAM_ASM_000379 /LENGTH=119 /DNA_ID=CAMNT_0028198857 /DNA_START=481 /DNA_END=840 /DNA_ORIENTATION=-
MIVKHDGAVVAQTTADTSHDEPADPAVGQPAAHVEVFDGQLTDEEQAEGNAKLSSGSVVSPVEVRLVGGAGDHGQIAFGEPALEHVQVVEGFGSPLELTLLKGVLRDTEADELAILNVV